MYYHDRQNDQVASSLGYYGRKFSNWVKRRVFNGTRVRTLGPNNRWHDALNEVGNSLYRRIYPGASYINFTRGYNDSAKFYNYATDFYSMPKDRPALGGFHESKSEPPAPVAHNNNIMLKGDHGMGATTSKASKSVDNLRGRRRKSRQFRIQCQPYIISRFQGLGIYDAGVYPTVEGVVQTGIKTSQPGIYGLYPRQMPQLTLDDIYIAKEDSVNSVDFATISDLFVDAVALPMFAFNLSALPSGYVKNPTQNAGAPWFPSTGIDHAACPFVWYQQMRYTVTVQNQNASNQTTFEYYAWAPVSGNQNRSDGSTVSPQPFVSQIEEARFKATNPAPVYNHDWSDIRLCLYGARTRPTSVKIHIVNFVDESATPPRLWVPATAPTDNDPIFNYQPKYSTTGSTNGFSNYLFKDLEDCAMKLPNGTSAGFLSSNYTGGAVANCGALTTRSNVYVHDEDQSLVKTTEIWDSHWANRLGHPLAFSKSYTEKKPLWRTKYSRTINLPHQTTVDADPQPYQHIHKIFKKFNKYHDTDIDDHKDNSLVVRDSDKRLLSAFNQDISSFNNHIYGSRPSLDDWLIIEGSDPFNTFSNGTVVSGKTENVIPYFGTGLADVNRCYTPPNLYGSLSSATGLISNDICSSDVSASFDMIIRNKYSVVSSSF